MYEHERRTMIVLWRIGRWHMHIPLMVLVSSELRFWLLLLTLLHHDGYVLELCNLFCQYHGPVFDTIHRGQDISIGMYTWLRRRPQRLLIDDDKGKGRLVSE
jgi:hypothetical protein